MKFLPTVSSVHLPILLTLPLQRRAPKRVQAPPHLDFGNADWAKYSADIDLALQSTHFTLTDQQFVDTMAISLVTILSDSAQTSIPQVSHNPRKPRLPAKYLHLICRSHTYFHLYRRTRIHRQLARTVQNYILAYKCLTWHNTCSKLNGLTDHP